MMMRAADDVLPATHLLSFVVLVVWRGRAAVCSNRL